MCVCFGRLHILRMRLATEFVSASILPYNGCEMRRGAQALFCEVRVLTDCFQMSCVATEDAQRAMEAMESFFLLLGASIMQRKNSSIKARIEHPDGFQTVMSVRFRQTHEDGTGVVKFCVARATECCSTSSTTCSGISTWAAAFRPLPSGMARFYLAPSSCSAHRRRSTCHLSASTAVGRRGRLMRARTESISRYVADRHAC